MSELSFTTPLFTLLAGLVEERAGLSYGLADRTIFEGKVSARAREAGFDSALDYYYFLRYDDATGQELQALVQALCVHETYFFRELTPLEVAVESFIAPRVRAGGKVRVWCAACSTGEEPLSLAIMLSARDLLPHVEIIASDISGAALGRARANRFGLRAVRGALPPYASRYLQGDELGYRAAPALFDAIAWRQINLLDDAAVAAVGDVDIVLCRNVLIYFSEDTAQRVVHRLARTMRMGGVLLVGVSESLLRFQVALHCEEHGGAFVYRKVNP